MGCQTTSVTSEPPVIGYVTRTEGFPVVNRNNQEYILARQSKIYEDDIFDTNKSSKLEISLADNTVISLGLRSHLVLHRFLMKENLSSTRLTLTKGALLTKMTRPASLELQTPLAAIRLQEAGVYASFMANRLEAVMTSPGNMVVSNDDGEAVASAAGFGTTVIAGSAPQAPLSWTPRRLQRVLRETTVQSKN
jgi:hypothetical protein|tara:strand:+ start:781 stop:1359 length:579 start_codon:yes stop_codon:yes gene_type:complete